jgi:crotonobetainyl-CoA hydratase
VTAPQSEVLVQFQQTGAVAVITLNRPKAMNAVNSAVSTAVGAALERLARDPSLRVGVVTGRGRAFLPERI